ncbi:hypothetical protein ATO49_00405 [Mycolicibacterium fortuitum subsp. fortuitum DSM 46621 = ATCC 6841 = JCM 6387]|nr:hypothetical protein ATO49_00405 [Mycolicibacterium fortuitum subsp. fortuitum DSM 46621 = ATCC 6841 = JCM 6387]
MVITYCGSPPRFVEMSTGELSPWGRLAVFAVEDRLAGAARLVAVDRFRRRLVAADSALRRRPGRRLCAG